MRHQNPLLTAEEQAHINAVRSQQPDIGALATLATLGRTLARADYHKVFIIAAHVVVVLACLFAGFKLYAIWQQYPGAAFLPFLDMHTPLMLFSGLFTINYIQHQETEGVAIIALLSTLLNALLV